jgi:plasmid stabilization system protein ParE
VRRKIVVRRIAEAELSEAYAWYELYAPGVGERFLDQFSNAAHAIAESPLRWPVYHHQVRRYVMADFPFVIYFDLRPDSVRILRVVHTSKDPGPVRDLLPE